MELNDSINAEFIKNSLISEIKNSFKNNLFSLNKITNNKEIDLKDEDFTVSGSINAKINYNYDSFKNLTTNLTIIIGEGQISNKYELNDGKINKFLQISDSIIFAATENGNIWEIDFTNNTKINKYQLNEERINSLIKASNGKVYVGTITNTIWEIDLETETAEKKFIGFGDKYDSKTLIEGSKDKLYVGTGIGNVYELDINTGNTKKYRFDDWGDVNALVKIAENKIYAGTSEGKLWEIDLETKTHKLKYDFKNKSNIIFDIKALSDTELILATEDKIYQYDLIKNEITEKINLKDGKIFSLSIEDLNNKIYATTDNNNVYELDSSFSQVKNKYELNASVYSSLIVDKKIFAGTITNVWELDIE
ncbi:PQQ-binding-like beta-propeller repeat protein [Spiroplasma endosymbiont of Apeira syringaria]|uniref:outer membrane protein assembly factor BamB family protein n=1 Tax=Spiroplasma endosymbiont of Apeira syringaria TaxID=3066307 RepID=UPI0030CD429C